jgi:osmotically-inducible protein OsmY
MNTVLAFLASAAATLSIAASDPIASSSGAQGEGTDVVNAIVQALNAEASFTNTKITVQMDKDVVLLTGATPTKQSAQRAGEIAAASANGAQVVNVIQPDKIEYMQAPQEPGKS